MACRTFYSRRLPQGHPSCAILCWRLVSPADGALLMSLVIDDYLSLFGRRVDSAPLASEVRAEARALAAASRDRRGLPLLPAQGAAVADRAARALCASLVLYVYRTRVLGQRARDTRAAIRTCLHALEPLADSGFVASTSARGTLLATLVRTRPIIPEVIGQRIEALHWRALGAHAGASRRTLLGEVVSAPDYIISIAVHRAESARHLLENLAALAPLARTGRVDWAALGALVHQELDFVEATRHRGFARELASIRASWDGVVAREGRA